jgi:hypothetical protein
MDGRKKTPTAARAEAYEGLSYEAQSETRQVPCFLSADAEFLSGLPDAAFHVHAQLYGGVSVPALRPADRRGRVGRGDGGDVGRWARCR